MAGALIGALRVSLSAETSAFEAGMRRSQKTAQTTANSIVGSFGQAGGAIGLLKTGVAGFIASLSVGTIIAAGKAALDYAGSLGEVAQQLGVTTRDLQVLRYAAGQVGVSQEQLETGLSKLTVTLGRVAAGAEAPAKALNAIGISVEDLKGKDTGEAFRIIADGLQKVEDRSQRAAVEVALFGKSGAQLDNLLSGGSAQVNELADAAERLGIVLSDEQIQKADDTADKIEALSTALKARIAGDVADNAQAIYQFADALLELASKAMAAKAALVEFQKNYSLPNLLGPNTTFGFNRAGRSVSVPLGAARRVGPPASAGGSGNISQFLAGGGGGRSRRGGRSREDHSAERALSDANQFDQELRRAQIDVLNATKDLATDAVERYAISIQIKDAEDAAYQAELQYQTQLYKLTEGQQGLSEAQAAQLQAQHDITSDLERKKLIAEEQQRAFEESAKLDDLQFDLERDRLQSEAQLADTASEQREVQLRLLDLAYRQERARLQTILADEQSSEAAKEEARRRLENLNKTFGNDRQSVINGTRGPLEQLRSELPLDPDQLNEALENVAAHGLKSLEDGLIDVLKGTKSVKEAFHDLAASILEDLLRIAIKKFIIGTILKLTGLGGAKDGGLVPGFAYGGFVSGPGGPREDKVPAMLSAGEFVINAKATRQFLPLLKRINDGGVGKFAVGGLAIPRASYGSRAGVSNDNGMGGMPRMEFTFHNDFRGADPSTVAAIKVRQDQFERELPAQVVKTMSDARQRFIWREK